MARSTKPKTEELVPVSIRIPVSLREEIEVLAEKEERSLNQMVIRLLRIALDARKQDQPQAGE